MSLHETLRESARNGMEYKYVPLPAPPVLECRNSLAERITTIVGELRPTFLQIKTKVTPSVYAKIALMWSD